MRFAGGKRKIMALTLLAVLAGLTWLTLDPGKIRLVVLILLGGFALRIALTGSRNEEEAEER
jgi:hypothetical protein